MVCLCGSALLLSLKGKCEGIPWSSGRVAQVYLDQAKPTTLIAERLWLAQLIDYDKETPFSSSFFS